MSRRTILSALVFAVVAPVMAAQAAPPPVRVTKIKVNNLIPAGDKLIANATMTLNIAGRKVTQDVQFPVTLGARPGANAACPILNLTLGPIHLNLLGLVVNLDNCAGGPVTVDVTAVPGAGHLLGNLLCSVAGLLNGGLDLNGLLATLNLQQLAVLESGLTDLLNQVLAQALAAPAAAPAAPAGACQILNLQIPNGLHLKLLGLNVDTSAICLDVYAVSAPGNLLGNLLCDVVGLLNSPGNNTAAIQALLKNIVQLLQALGL